MINSSVHLTKPKRRSSLSQSLPSGDSVHSGYDSDHSDKTEVTSNTQPSHGRSPLKTSMVALSIHSATKSMESERWSSGDAAKPAKRCIALCLMDRRNSGSTSSTTSDESMNDDDDNDHDECNCEAIPKEVQEKECHADQEAAEYDDLKSKPGIIQVQEEDELLLDDYEDQSFAAASKASKHSTSGATATSSSSSSSFILTEERVRAHMKDYYEDFDSIFRHGKSSEAIWDSFFKQYYTEDILWVRSSSNTLKGPELAEHFANDIVGIRMQLVSIENIQILGGMNAVVVFTADQEFEYRGHPVSDRTVLTMVLHVDASGGRGQERIRIAHEHRCVGKPIPKNTRWGSGIDK